MGMYIHVCVCVFGRVGHTVKPGISIQRYRVLVVWEGRERKDGRGPFSCLH